MKTTNTRPKTPSDVARYLGDDKITDYQARILNECGKSAKSYPFDRVVTNPNLLPCRHRFCPWCQKTRAQAWALGLRAVIDEEGDSGDENEVQLSPYWVELTLPGIPTAVPELRNFLELMKEYLSLACNQSYWRYRILTGLAILRFQLIPVANRENQVMPTYTLIANISKKQIKKLDRMARKASWDWIHPKNRVGWPGVELRYIPTETRADRDILQARVADLIEYALVYPDKQTFLEFAKQLKGVNAVVMCRTQRKPLFPPKYEQRGDLRYEQEYIVSRLGEDLQVSLSGNRTEELLPWHLAH